MDAFNFDWTPPGRIVIRRLHRFKMERQQQRASKAFHAAFYIAGFVCESA